MCPNKKSDHTLYNFELASGCNKTKNNMNKKSEAWAARPVPK